MLEGGAADFDRFVHDVAGGCGDCGGLGFCHFVCSSHGAYLGAPEGLIDVDVAESGDE